MNTITTPTVADRLLIVAVLLGTIPFWLVGMDVATLGAPASTWRSSHPR